MPSEPLTTSGLASGPARFERVAVLRDVETAGSEVVHANGHTVALFSHEGRVYAVDNRCPHMGFPLQRGSIEGCILTCHWHHARFDLASGGTFDPWADDVRTFPVEIREGEVWIDVAEHADPAAHQRERVHDGIARNIPLVLAKAVIFLLDRGEDPAGPFRIGLEFGAHYRWQGWGGGLTTLTCLMNLLPKLEPSDRPRALYQGLSSVAQECHGAAPRFPLRPLPRPPADLAIAKRWLRQFIEVRDSEGAERCVLSAIRAGASPREMADLLFSAATDHRYIDTGHSLDFTNKALEALDLAGWELAELVLGSLVRGYATAERMEESNAWRHPVDLIPILVHSFEKLAPALAEGHGKRGVWSGRAALVGVIHGDDPRAIAEALLEALRGGATEEELGGSVAYAAALRVARFHTSNEFGDWDRAHHTFTFANAVHQGLRRAPSVELLRGAFDASMSVYLDRFLNVPPARLPDPARGEGGKADPEALLRELPGLLDQQQRVSEAGELVARYLGGGGDPDRLLATLGHVLLREDRDFHSIQSMEAAFRQHELLRGTPEAAHVLIAAARYLAAHAPTVRAQGQTYEIARRLHRGERPWEEA